MSKIKIRRATIRDVKPIVNLIRRHAKKGNMLLRKENEVVQNLRDYFVAVKPKRRGIVGCVALHIYTDRLSEIKALAVSSSVRGLGVGKRLVKRCLKEARDLGLPKVFVLTYIPEFFRKLKFEEAKKEMLPEKIWEECSKCAKYHCCPEICMAFTIKNR